MTGRERQPRGGGRLSVEILIGVVGVALPLFAVAAAIWLLRGDAQPDGSAGPRESASASAVPPGPSTKPAIPDDKAEAQLAGGGESARAPTAGAAAPNVPPQVIVRQLQAADASGAEAPPLVLPTDDDSAVDGTPRARRSAEARRARVERFGGDRRSEDAVEAGLRWLARHQSPAGHWDPVRFQEQCPHDAPVCGGIAVKRVQYDMRPGLTGLALLAFTGAGYTDRHGPYQDNVRAAISALLRMQGPDGGFGPAGGLASYNDSLATFALAEVYALSGDERLRPRLVRAVGTLAASQQPGGGWDYPRGIETGRNDTSITAWAVQALQAAANAGIDVPAYALIRANLHFARATQRDGRVRYADAGTGFDLEDGSPEYRYGPAMVACGATCTPMLGWRRGAPELRRQAALIVGELPSAERLQGGDRTQLHSYYYWYYGTAAAFQHGGDTWTRWNGALRDQILPLQDREKRGDGTPQRHTYGSWPPFGPHWGKWGRMGGRVYTTALCALTLEVYYRHTPTWLEYNPLLTVTDWRRYLAEAGVVERRLAARALSESRLQVGEPLLGELLEDDDLEVALASASGLVAMDSARGIEVLRAALDVLPRSQQLRVRRTLDQAEALVRAMQGREGTLRAVDIEHGVATVQLQGAWLGLGLRVVEGAARGTLLRVVLRGEQAGVFAAEIIGGAAEELHSGAAVAPVLAAGN